MRLNELVDSGPFGLTLCRFSGTHDTASEVGIGLLAGDVVRPLNPDDGPNGSLLKILAAADPRAYVESLGLDQSKSPLTVGKDVKLLCPIEQQEIWGSGMTYQKDDLNSDPAKYSLYEKIYLAERPFLFFKSPVGSAVGPEGTVWLRSDTNDTIAEPELAAVIAPSGHVVGYSVGSDVTARDIESVNPLYLMQAKGYRGSCAFGPGIRLCSFNDLKKETISTTVRRGGADVFHSAVKVSQMIKSPELLAEWLRKGGNPPQGAVVITGNGIFFPKEFHLEAGDVVVHEITGLGVLKTHVKRMP